MIIIATLYGAFEMETNITPILQTRKWRPRGNITQLGIAKQPQDRRPIRAVSCQSWWPSDRKKMSPHSPVPGPALVQILYIQRCSQALKTRRKKATKGGIRTISESLRESPQVCDLQARQVSHLDFPSGPLASSLSAGSSAI